MHCGFHCVKNFLVRRTATFGGCGGLVNCDSLVSCEYIGSNKTEELEL